MAHLSEAAVAKIKEIINRYKGETTPLMMILSDIQKEYGYIPLEVQELVSEETGISVAEIYGVVTFYSFFSLKPKGRFVVGICLGTACYVKGAQQVIDKFSEVLGIGAGQTTEDGLCGHSLEEAIRNVNRAHYELDDSATEDDLEFTGKSKTDFALDLIYKCSDYCIPDYIKSGLKWLNDQRVLE